MTDDHLVKTTRSNARLGLLGSPELLTALADRIEALEAENRRLKTRLDECSTNLRIMADQGIEQADRITELEADVTYLTGMLNNALAQRDRHIERIEELEAALREISDRGYQSSATSPIVLLQMLDENTDTARRALGGTDD